MRIEMTWSILASEMDKGKCCLCGQAFGREVIQASLISDSDRLDIGEVCPACLSRGSDYIEKTAHSKLTCSAMLHETALYMEKRALEERLDVCPSIEEFELFKASVDGPRYATQEEANEAWDRGEW